MNKIEENIKNEVNLLLSIIELPKNYTKDRERYLTILKNQKNFANYSDRKREIFSYSLNTHKSYIEKHSQYSYLEYDLLRRKAYKTLKCYETEVLTSKRNKSNKDLEILLESLMKNNLLLNSIITTLIEKLSVYAYKSKNAELVNDFKYHQNQLKKILSEINE
ncbi:hypothetical protein ACGE66_003470 [Acinetobacter baumannii]